MVGIELIFLMLAGMGLWFGFMLKAVLQFRDVSVIAEQCLQGVKAFSDPLATPPARRLGVHKKLEGTQPGQLSPADLRDVPHHMVSDST